LSLPARTRLGVYEIISLLGAGGMGEVYRARDERLGRDVAIKLLSAEQTADPERLRRFEKEARAASSLSHPNIVTIHEVQQTGPTSYIVMELVEGKTLRELLADGPLAVRRLLAIGAQVADGLAQAHTSGIVHRDLKPENVMITREGLVKVLDFGLAKLTQPDTEGGQPIEASTVTKPGLVMGTVGYMSPEQASGHPVDFHSDQFSLGTILYEMATGIQPFKRATDAQTLAAIIQDEPESIGALSPKVSAPVRWIVDRCLAKEPRLRYVSTEDLARELATVRDRLPEFTSGAPLVPVAQRPRFLQRPGLLIAAVLLAAAVAGVFLSRNSGPRPPLYHVQLAPPSGMSFGSEAAPLAISPDGQRIVFLVRNAEGNNVLFLREFAEPEARPLPGTEGALSPFWSPDSRTVGFFTVPMNRQPRGGKLKRVGISEASAVEICDAPDQAGGSWGPAGVILFGARNGPVYRVPAAGGNPSATTRLDSGRREVAHRFPYFLPDGHRFLFVARLNDRSQSLRAASLESPSTQAVSKAESTVAYAPPGYLLSVTADRTLVAEAFDTESLKITGSRTPIAENVSVWAGTGAFSVSSTGVLAYKPWRRSAARTLAWYDRAGNQRESFPAEKEYWDNIALSPDGMRFVGPVPDPYTADTFNLWLYDFARGTTTRLTFGSSWWDNYPWWSPDGKQIVFSSNRRGTLDLYLKTVTGTESESVLLASDHDKFANDWSRDGRFVLYETFAEGQTSLWALPMEGERKPFRVTRTAFREEYGRFSPDGRFIAYLSDESGGNEVYVQTFPQPTERWRVSSGGALRPIWREDGKELFYLTPDHQLMSVEIQTRPVFAASAPRRLFQLARGPESYDVAPDGRRFLFVTTRSEVVDPPISLVFNWLPESER
jgi:Tol biopolymer transport system component